MDLNPRLEARLAEAERGNIAQIKILREEIRSLQESIRTRQDQIEALQGEVDDIRRIRPSTPAGGRP